jgi:lipoate-protein ligase B
VGVRTPVKRADDMNEHSNHIVCRAVDLGIVPYFEALRLQKDRVERLQSGRGGEMFYLLQHPHVVTIGRNATGDALIADPGTMESRGVEVARTDRGGDVTYHGPGQLVGYPILLLEPGRRDIRRYVHDLEEVLIRTLSDFGIRSERHAVHRGVWTGGKKIASLGIRISRWVTCHGFALNVDTDLSFYSLIVPCGITGCEMTSMAVELGGAPEMIEVERAVVSHFSQIYNRAVDFEAAGAATGRRTA